MNMLSEMFLKNLHSEFNAAQGCRPKLRVLILKTELKPSIQKRSLKAFIDLAILCALTNEPLTGYGINTHFMNTFGFMVSPSVIYNNLPYLERKGWIKCIKNQRSRTYILTDQGKEITDNITSLIDQIRSFTVNLQKLKTHL